MSSFCCDLSLQIMTAISAICHEELFNFLTERLLFSSVIKCYSSVLNILFNTENDIKNSI